MEGLLIDYSNFDSEETDEETKQLAIRLQETQRKVNRAAKDKGMDLGHEFVPTDVPITGPDIDRLLNRRLR